jgi:hypothetical protein
MDALLPHRADYDVSGHIAIADIAESLVVNGKLAMEAAFNKAIICASTTTCW